MTLDDIRNGVDVGQIFPAEADTDLSIEHVTEDSRNVRPGSMFAAVQGECSDGHAFIDEAIRAGAVAVLTDRVLEGVDVPVIVVEHTRRALGWIAHELRDRPSDALCVIGVTGTNGKSSTVAMIGHILRTAGKSVACFGTLGYTIGDQSKEAPHTTPFNEDLADLFAEARDAGCDYVVMEVSSHALEQERISGIGFDAALFTNLTQDHLDYHVDMHSYRDEKLKLFSGISKDTGITIANSDDPYYEDFADAGARTQWSFGHDSDVSATNIELNGNRTEFTIESPWGRTRCSLGLLGEHNVQNFLGAVAMCGAFGVSIDTIAEAAHTLPSIPGRFESIDRGQDFRVVVDYAHTEDGLRNVLEASRRICSAKVIVVFGCGGDRDKTKRPKMAAVAAELADYSILTSDNPRSESPERILLDAEVGLQRAGKKRDDEYEVIESRADAIHAALDRAQSGDLVLIAGKGHEDYQILNTGTIHFDDREVAAEWLEGRA